MLARRATARITAQFRASRSLHSLGGPGLPSTLPAAVTLLVDSSQRKPSAVLQQEVLKGVSEGLARTAGPTAHNAAVILASPPFWPWLDDDAFVSSLLTAAGVRPHANRGAVTMLAAAVDGVPRGVPKLDPFTPADGISIICGDTTELLPAVRRHATEPPTNQSPIPSLEFRTPSNRGGSFKGVMLPLANTLFTLGKPNPLVVSEWETAPGGRLRKLFEDTVRTNQTVVIRKPGRRPEASPHPVAHGKLIALTGANRVLSSLGNVLSAVWANGQKMPASQELEAIIPSLLKTRASACGSEARRPSHSVDVWALVIPEHVVTILMRDDTMLKPLDMGPNVYDQWSEQNLADASVQSLNTLLRYGCRLSKVVSGGGGWGAKRGLLALDPQRTIDDNEAENQAAFASSLLQQSTVLRGETPAGKGNYVQFLVEPMAPADPPVPRDPPPSSTPPPVLSTVFGMPSRSLPPAADADPAVTPLRNLFGAASAAGLFLREQFGRPTPIPPAGPGVPRPAGEERLPKDGGWRTKLDVPGSFVSGAAWEVGYQALEGIRSLERMRAAGAETGPVGPAGSPKEEGGN